MSKGLFDPLIERVEAVSGSLNASLVQRWATVTQASPLRVQIDGDDTVFPVAPQSAVPVLFPGERVIVTTQNRRAVIVSVAGRPDGQLRGNAARAAQALPLVPEGTHFYRTDLKQEQVKLGNAWVPLSQRVLWSGAWYMSASQTAVLSGLVSEQQTGIVLAWSQYENGAVRDYGWNYSFVPWNHAIAHSGTGVSSQLSAAGSSATWQVARKYVYVSNDRISGNNTNDVAGASAGYVLRYVYGI